MSMLIHTLLRTTIECIDNYGTLFKLITGNINKATISDCIVADLEPRDRDFLYYTERTPPLSFFPHFPVT